MKKNKWIIALFLSVFCLLFVACEKSGQGTYYPDSTEMKDNLEKEGYTVSVESHFDEKYTGTYLSAEKGTDYIEFYWLDEAEAVAYISEEMEKKYKEYDRIVSIENDNQYGNLIFCGTNSAVDASGIEIVEVEVKVDVK